MKLPFYLNKNRTVISTFTKVYLLLVFLLCHHQRSEPNFPRLILVPFLLSTSVEPRFCFSVNSLNKLSFEVRTKRLIKTKAMEFYSDVFTQGIVQLAIQMTRLAFFPRLSYIIPEISAFFKNDD